MADSQSVWLITLGMRIPGLPFGPEDRAYKTFAVSKATGEVLSMKIREVARAD